MESREKGFSLIELMVAMVVTLIISGAVFQLVTAGQSAFRKEPAVADRQQNIRMAMDIIAQDLFQAGYGMPSFAQAFTNELDGVGPMGSGGQETDELEIFRATECPALRVCPIPGNGSVSIKTVDTFSACYTLPAIVLLGNENEWDLRWAKAPGQGQAGGQCFPSGGGGSGGGGGGNGGGGGSTTNQSGGGGGGGGGGGDHGHAIFPPGQSPLNPSGGFRDWASDPTYMMVGQAIRYRINLDADDVPNLERSEAGGQPDIDGNSTWRIIARGIEDFQVEYRNAAGWQNTPGAIDCGPPEEPTGCTTPAAADYDRLIRRVRVTLSARVTEGGPMAGETASAALPDIQNAIRGQLVTEVAPRPATTALQVFGGEL